MGHQERHDGQRLKASWRSGQVTKAASLNRLCRPISSITWRPQLRGSETRQGGLPG
jgi:hypothetical protein